jgi:hypothetical protein
LQYKVLKLIQSHTEREQFEGFCFSMGGACRMKNGIFCSCTSSCPDSDAVTNTVRFKPATQGMFAKLRPCDGTEKRKKGLAQSKGLLSQRLRILLELATW